MRITLHLDHHLKHLQKKEAIELKFFKVFSIQIKLPFVLIGGINHKNIKILFNFKPNYVAIIDSLWNFKDGPVESDKSI